MKYSCRNPALSVNPDEISIRCNPVIHSTRTKLFFIDPENLFPTAKFKPRNFHLS